MYRKSYIEVNLDNMCKNVKNIIKTFPDYEYYIGVVKGNAYGYGTYVAKYMLECGINYLAVSSLEEAIDVRKYVGSKVDLLCLEPIDLKYIDEILKYNITICVSSKEYFDKLISLNKNIKFHLKINTGMNRLGVSSIDDIKYIYDKSIDNNTVALEGIFSHFATSGIFDDLYKKQIDKFRELTANIDLKKIKIIHLGRSSSLEMHSKIEECNGIRLGAMLYGIESNFPNYSGIRGKLRKIKYDYIRNKNNLPYPYESRKIKLINSLILKSEIIQIQKIKTGDHIGYGFRTKLDTEGYVAILPIGYSDGIPSKYKSWMVSINNKKYKVIGSINMGMIQVLVDDTVKIGDTVTLISEEDNIRLLSNEIGISPYNLITCLNPLLPRIYLKDNKIIYDTNNK